MTQPCSAFPMSTIISSASNCAGTTQTALILIILSAVGMAFFNGAASKERVLFGTGLWMPSMLGVQPHVSH